MIQDKTKLFPIGTVVELKDTEKMYVITGYFRLTPEGQIMDYSGVEYPKGDKGPSSYILFDEEAIRNIVFEGLRDQDYEYLENNIDIIERDIHNRVGSIIAQGEIRRKKDNFKGLE